MQRLSVPLPEPDRLRLQELAERESRSEANMAALLLRQALKEREKGEDAHK